MAKGEEVRNKKVVLKNYVIGFPKETDLEVVATDTVKLAVPENSNTLLLKNLYLSCDSHMRLGMSKHEEEVNTSEFIPGEAISGLGVSKVIESSHPDFQAGDYVWGTTGWEQYSLISDPADFFKITYTDLPLSYYTGLLGMPGFTAYLAVHEVYAPKKGDCVYISAAAGAVGQLIGQFVKHLGCYVVGSAGSDAKVDILKSKFGFDDAFNYRKEHDLNAALKRYFPKGIDVYYEHVGGAMLDAAILNMRNHGHIIAIGMISQYNLQKHEGVHNMFYIVEKRLTIRGFLVFDHYDIYPKFVEYMAPLIREGKISYLEDIVEGLHRAPAALMGLFSGRNVGKQLVAVGEE